LNYDDTIDKAVKATDTIICRVARADIKIYDQGKLLDPGSKEYTEARDWLILNHIYPVAMPYNAVSSYPYGGDCGGCTGNCDDDDCNGCACDDDPGTGGVCRHCGQPDDYPEKGADGKVCCWRCADREADDDG